MTAMTKFAAKILRINYSRQQHNVIFWRLDVNLSDILMNELHSRLAS